MFAQWCLIAWKVAIGRPNCSRIFAYPAAISVVSAATPAASAASTALATSVSRPRAPGSTVAGAASRLTRAAGRLGSRFFGTSACTPPADFSITSTSSPAGTSSTSARWPLSTTPAGPVAVPPAGPPAGPSATATSPPSAAAPITLPSASPGSSRLRRSSGAAAASTALAITVGTNGPGARCRPICSATTSVSASPKPEPPSSSGTCSPSRPRPLSSAQKAGSCSVPPSSRLRAAARDWCLVSRPATVCARARCSSLMAIDMDK